MNYFHFTVDFSSVHPQKKKKNWNNFHVTGGFKLNDFYDNDDSNCCQARFALSVTVLTWTWTVHVTWLSRCCRWWSGRRPRRPTTGAPSLPPWAPRRLPTCSHATIVKSKRRFVPHRQAVSFIKAILLMLRNDIVTVTEIVPTWQEWQVSIWARPVVCRYVPLQIGWATNQGCVAPLAQTPLAIDSS